MTSTSFSAMLIFGSCLVVSRRQSNYAGVPGLLFWDFFVTLFLGVLFFQSDRVTQSQETHSRLNQKKGGRGWRKWTSLNWWRGTEVEAKAWSKPDGPTKACLSPILLETMMLMIARYFWLNFVKGEHRNLHYDWCKLNKNVLGEGKVEKILG